MFAGEGVLDAVRPGEKRLISYAADPAVRVSTREHSTEKPVSRIRIAKGVMVTTKEERESKTYKIYNSDNSPRHVIIEHPVRSEWKLAGNLKPEESSASFYRFRINLEAKKNSEMVIEEYRPEQTELALTNLTSDEVVLLTEQKRITPAMEGAFRRILAQKNVVAQFDEQLKADQHEAETITTDQSRVRENMKALKGSTDECSLVLTLTAGSAAYEMRRFSPGRTASSTPSPANISPSRTLKLPASKVRPLVLVIQSARKASSESSFQRVTLSAST